MSEKCFRCGKLLPESYTMTIGGPQGSTADDIGWHWINAAPHAASGGIMVPVCNKCDPPPVFIKPRSILERDWPYPGDTEGQSPMTDDIAALAQENERLRKERDERLQAKAE